MAKKKNKGISFEKLAVILFFVCTTLLYFYNATRDIYAGDVGDLVTASYVFGVAHPPGYPLFTLLGFIFSHLPFPIPPVTKVAYISVIASLVGLYLFYRFAKDVTKNMYISLLSTSVLAFSHFYWVHAELPEVFGLNNFLVIAILFLALRFYHTKKLVYFYLLGFFTGLSLTHHQTILFVLPGALFLILRHIKLLLSEKKIIPLGITSLLLGLTPYLYIPIASLTNPVVNWDNVRDIGSFIHLILRKDYGVFAPPVGGGTPGEIKLIFLKDYFKTLMDLYSYQIFFVGALGIVQLLKKNTWLFAGLLITFILSGPFFIFYGAPTISSTAAWGIIERMYVFSTVVFVFFIPFGFLFIKEFFAKRFPKKIYGSVVIGYFLIIPLFMLWYNFPKADLSKTHIGNNLADDILSQLPQRAVLFTSGDTTTFNLWYAHYVLGKRQNIGLINPPGVGGNDFLDVAINDYKKRYPETRLSGIYEKTINDLRQKRRIFGTFRFDYKSDKDVLVPYGLVYELVDKENVPEIDAYIATVEPQLRTLHIVRRETLPLRDSNLIASEIPLIYSNALVRIGDFMASQYKNFGKAEHYYRRALWIDDENPQAYSGLSIAQYQGYKDCKNAIYNMKEAIRNYRVWKVYYVQLYTLYERCKVDKKVVDDFKKKYKAEFKSDIEREIQSATTIPTK